MIARFFAVAMAATLALTAVLPTAAQTAGEPVPHFPVLVGDPANFVVVLDHEPLSEVWDTQTDAKGRVVPQMNAEAQAARSAIQVQQAKVAAEISAQGGQVLSQYEAIMNGLLVQPPEGGVEALRRIPGVKAVYRAPYFTPSLEDSVPFVGTDQVMAELGIDGSGVNVAIIDTGIDYYHAAFGGSGDVEEFRADDPDIVEEGTFPNDKVVGGYDFAGTLYVPSCTIAQRAAGQCSPNPKPDDDPRDEQGHGTHVGSIAAGLATDEIHHGVAPGASVVALKVYGAAAAGTQLVTDALEWTVKARAGIEERGTPARVDVINMSLGSLYALSLSEEEDVVARVVDAGIVVVAAAGNDGDIPFILGSPAASEAAVAVASSFAPGEDALGVTARWEIAGEPQEKVMKAQEGAFTRSLEDTGPVTDTLIWMGRACDIDPIVERPEDAFALIARGECTFQEKLGNAIDAGATGAVVFSQDNNPIPMGGDNNVNIPGVMIGNDDGVTLKELLEQGIEIEVTLDNSVRIPLPELEDAISGFSSRGPARLGGMKPDITAPGSNIDAAQVGGGTAGQINGGTSMAAPHVAGAAALVLQHFGDKYIPGLEAENPRGFLNAYDVGRLLSSTAHPETYTTDANVRDLAPVARQGNGRLDVVSALNSETLIRAGKLAGLNFGYKTLSDDLTVERPMQIVNLGTDSKYYRVAARPAVDAGSLAAPAVEVRSTLEDTVIRVDPRDQVTLYVSMQADAEELGKLSPVVRGGDDVASGAIIAKGEAFGFVDVQEVDKLGQPKPDGDLAHVAYYAMPDPVSNVSALQEELSITKRGHAGAEMLELHNTTPGPGDVEAFTWAGSDARETSVPGSIDIVNVGVRTNTDSEGEPVLEFAIDVAGTYTVPTQVAYYVYMDTNSDGRIDWVLLALDPGLLLGTGVTGSFLSFAVPAPGGQPDFDNGIPQYWSDVRLRGSYAIMQISLEQMGIDGPDNQIDFFAAAQDTFGDTGLEGFDVAPGGVSTNAQPTGLWSYDLAYTAAEATNQSVNVSAGEPASVRVVGNPRPDDGPQASGVMLVYPYNHQGTAPEGLMDDTQVVPVNLSNVRDGWAVYMPSAWQR